MSKTPHLDKLAEAAETSQAVGEFLAWLSSKNMVIHQWTTNLTIWHPCMELSCENGVRRSPAPSLDGTTCKACNGAGGHERPAADRFVPISQSFEDLLADFYGIDQQGVERERRALLVQMRKDNATDAAAETDAAQTDNDGGDDT